MTLWVVRHPVQDTSAHLVPVVIRFQKIQGFLLSLVDHVEWKIAALNLVVQKTKNVLPWVRTFHFSLPILHTLFTTFNGLTSVSESSVWSSF